MGKALEFLTLDFFDPKEFSIPLSFSSIDYREIGKRKGSFSKTIVMPSTKRNDAYFGYAFSVDNEARFDPKVKVAVRIQEIEFEGILQLKSIQLKNGKTLSYSVNIFGDLGGWASLIGEGTLRDLTHHTSHTLTKDNIINSWSGEEEYVYPLINYGNRFRNEDAGFNLDPSLWRPAFFAIPLIRQIFKEVGYTFIDTDLQRTPLKDLILPFTSKEVEFDDTIFDAEASQPIPSTIEIFNAALIVDGKNSTSATQVYRSKIPFLSEDEDNSNLFDLPNSSYYVQSDGVYSFNGSVKIDHNATSERNLNPGDVIGYFSLSLQVISSSGGVSDIKLSPDFDVFHFQNTTTDVPISLSQQLSKGDIVILLFSANIFGTQPGSNLKNKSSFDFRHNSGTYKIHPTNLPLVAGSTINHAKVIQNIKKIDLIREVISLGNFRVITNNQDRTIEFINADSFLKEEQEDWSTKLDTSRQSSITHIQNDGAKELEWNYNNDTDDAFVEELGERFDEPFARARVQMDSEFRKGTQVIKGSIFSSTVDRADSLGGTLMPSMAKSDSDGSFDTSHENRILIWGGLRSGSIIVDQEAQSQYPYSYFSDSTFSLTWDESNFNPSVLGLVNRYYQSTISTLNNSKLLSCWMWLTSKDISNLDFRTVKVIDGSHYYLNNIKDYQVNKNTPTRVELISR